MQHMRQENDTAIAVGIWCGQITTVGGIWRRLLQKSLEAGRIDGFWSKRGQDFGVREESMDSRVGRGRKKRIDS